MKRQNIGCVKAATRIIGDKWTPIILRAFVNEDTVRFCQIQDLAAGINPRTLSARLESLEQQGIIERTNQNDTARSAYRLTQKGRELTPILRDMQLWGETYPIN